MSDIKIHVFHTGEVCVAPELPFGGDHCNAVKASGVFGKKADRLWLPVSAYLIEHPKGKFLVDTGWARDVSPNGEFDKKAQIKSLGSVLLYEVNQGRIGLGQCIDEQLLAMGIKDSDIDAVLITHLDCDHANGLKQVKNAKKFVVSADEVRFAVKVKNADGKFVLLFSDGGYARKSWEEQITSGIAADKKLQKESLAWIRAQSLDENCIESLANHEPDVVPHVIEL